MWPNHNIILKIVMCCPVSDCIPIFFISPAFDLALPCFLEEGVLVNVTMRWSQFQQDGQLIWRIFDFHFYRDCTRNIAKATTTTGLYESWSMLLFDDKCGIP